MAKSKMKRKRAPKSVLKLPDLEQSKSAVLNSLTSPSSQRTYDHAIREFIECIRLSNAPVVRLRLVLNLSDERSEISTEAAESG